jgi:imidazole glycerol-phosphate synthase subunit HisH
VVRDAAGVVLPGVGAFGACMDAVERTGVADLAHEVVEAGTPFLGICVGMQLLYEASEESPGRPGLGLLPGEVQLLPAGVKRPQMQWNLVEVTRPTALFEGVPEPIWMYFVHSVGSATRVGRPVPPREVGRGAGLDLLLDCQLAVDLVVARPQRVEERSR